MERVCFGWACLVVVLLLLYICCFCFDAAFRWIYLLLAGWAAAVLSLDVHAFYQGGDAGSDVGFAVYDHDAVGAAADGAEDAAGFMLFFGVAVFHDAGGPKGGGDGFAFVAFHFFAV